MKHTHAVDDLPDIVSGLTSLDRRVLQAVPRDTYTKATRVLCAAAGEDVPSLEPYLTEGRWADVNHVNLLGAKHAPQVLGLAEFAALVRLAQPFRTRYPLIEGRGHFGTVRGDPPADHYYSECRLTPLGVDVLAGRAPNALLNGAPSFLLSHHAADVARVLALIADRPSAPIEEIIEAIVGPDIATGGIIEDTAPLRRIYAGAAASIVVRARIEVEGGALVVDEIPFGVSTGEIVEQLWHPKRADSLVYDIADDGHRLFITLLPGVDLAHAKAVLQKHPVFAQKIDAQPTVRENGRARQVDLRDLARAYLESAAPTKGTLASLGESPRRTRLG